MVQVDGPDYIRAPRWRQSGAALVDVAVLGGLWWLARDRGWTREGGLLRRLAATPGEPLREQLRSPGQRLLGTRTVDRRTGRRLALWRTALLAASAVAGQELARRLAVPETPEQQRRSEAFDAELREIMLRHPQATPERAAERDALLARYPKVGPNVLRAVAPALAVGLLNRRLRRRLAPTVEVLARGRSDHSP